ncbi:hypothetical protein [Lichenifustis flavocetrariae]|uniref:Uncharacterized protein n=1 Tax=Lichenifustis flavocetrariae TaxID=2949735 RepID=A0AA41ZAE6_9HYPH|nr:hypothetical protein [Lichenifustis flavocetrariae]MCW6512252.1 hypothetical protein [Lichenifustis flavocetrariae]
MVRDKIEKLYERLVDERRRLVGVAAESATVPPSSLLTQIAALDGSISGTEAVLDEISMARRAHATKASPN